jgi:surface polysaccharide O-acyltransferase-like enzyme
MMNEKKLTRNKGYDILRIIAILFVLFCHKYSYSAPELIDGIDFWYVLTLALSILYKSGPPLFLMISGALLLGKTESFQKILTHRILRFLILMAGCTVVVCIIHSRNNFPFRVDRVFFGELNWYLYAYLAFLLMLPFLRLIAQNADEGQQKLYLILTFVFYSISGLFLFLGVDAKLLDNMPLFNTVYASNCWQLTFPLAGYFIANVIKNGDPAKIRKLKIAAGIAALLNLFQGEILFSLDRFTKDGLNLEMMRQHACFGPACLIFILCLLWAEKAAERAAEEAEEETEEAADGERSSDENGFGAWFLAELSAATLGVFLIETHTNFSGLLSLKIVEWPIVADLPYTRSILAVAIEFTAYSLFVILLRRIPGVKKIL